MSKFTVFLTVCKQVSTKPRHFSVHFFYPSIGFVVTSLSLHYILVLLWCTLISWIYHWRISLQFLLGSQFFLPFVAVVVVVCSFRGFLFLLPVSAHTFNYSKNGRKKCEKFPLSCKFMAIPKTRKSPATEKVKKSRFSLYPAFGLEFVINITMSLLEIVFPALFHPSP